MKNSIVKCPAEKYPKWTADEALEYLMSNLCVTVPGHKLKITLHADGIRRCILKEFGRLHPARAGDEMRCVSQTGDVLISAIIEE